MESDTQATRKSTLRRAKRPKKVEKKPAKPVKAKAPAAAKAKKSEKAIRVSGNFEEHCKRVVDNYSMIFAITNDEEFLEQSFQILGANDHVEAKANLIELLKENFKAKEEASSAASKKKSSS